MSEEDLQRRRAERARNGSRRKRDQAALRDQERAGLDRFDVYLAGRQRELGTPRANEAWSAIMKLLSERFPGTYEIYFAPLRLLGEHESRLIITGKESRVCRWIERRYREVLTAAVRKCSEFEHFEIERWWER
jgi:hypothetical protein